MIDLVHYMAAHLGKEHGIAYPTEIPELNRPTIGSLFIFGCHYHDIKKMYNIHAVMGEQLFLIKLRQSESNHSYFISRVKDVGIFYFLLESILVHPKYVGDNPNLNGLLPIRRLRMLRPQDHDQACRDHDFYFCGFSPSVAEEVAYPLDTPD